MFDSELEPWAALVLVAACSILFADLTVRSAQGSRLLLAGLDRITLKDRDREAHCESAALLLGYLLGLPCFCFQADTSEALKMILNYRGSMEAYKQQPSKKNSLSNTKPVDANGAKTAFASFGDGLRGFLGGYQSGKSPGISSGATKEESAERGTVLPAMP
eukprot:gene5067-6453_t